MSDSFTVGGIKGSLEEGNLNVALKYGQAFDLNRWDKEYSMVEGAAQNPEGREPRAYTGNLQ